MFKVIVVRFVQTSQTDPVPHEETPAAVTFVYSKVPSNGVGNHCLTSAMFAEKGVIIVNQDLSIKS